MFHANLFLACLLGATSLDGQGHAAASWHPGKADALAGESVRTVIRMRIDEGWHTYWRNPGEAGIPIAVRTMLPDGWSAGELKFPAPKRMMSSGLSSFCHKGTILLPLVLTPPAGFAGKLPPMTAELTWLACNDDSCVPGKATLSLSQQPDEKAVTEAHGTQPSGIPGAKLTVSEANNALSLRMIVPDGWETDLSGFDVFPATRNIVDPKAVFHFGRDPADANAWIASAPKSEYLEGKPDGLILLLADASGKLWEVSTAPEPGN